MSDLRDGAPVTITDEFGDVIWRGTLHDPADDQ